MNKKPEEEYIKINFSRRDRHTKVHVRMITFEDGEFMIAYMPSLNLSGYGNSEGEAIRMLTEVVMPDYLASLIRLPEAKAMAELREYGWKRRPILSKELTNTQFLDTKKITHDFDLPIETQFNERFITA